MLNFKECPPVDWVDPCTGEVVPGMGRIVKTGQMLAVEGLFDQEFDRFMAGIREGEGGDPNAEAAVIDGETIVSKRGKIVDFSKRSQARLMKALSGWEPGGDLLIITLTYPKEFPDCAGAKEDFERFRRWMRGTFPEWCGLWKIEYQTRGAPHFHLVIDPYRTKDQIRLRQLRDAIKEQWRVARRSPVPSRTQCDFARENHAAKYYLVKEVGKLAQSSKEWRAACEAKIEHTGRVWGWVNPDAMHFKADEWAVPVNIGWLFRAKIQEVVERDMLKRGAIKAKNGALFYHDGNPLDRSRLPSWQLLTDPDAEFMRICREIKAETGYDFHADAKRLDPDFQSAD